MKQNFKLILVVMLAGIAMATTSITQKVTCGGTADNKSNLVKAGKLSMKERRNFIDSCLRVMSAHPAYIGDTLKYANTQRTQNAFAGSFSNNVFIGSHATNKGNVFSGGSGNLHIMQHSKIHL